jgi:glutaredoxin
MSRILCAAAALLLAGAAGAGVYSWTDENGKTHFSDRAPAGAQAEEVDATLRNTFSTTPDAPARRQPAPAAAKPADGVHSTATPGNKVVMYATSWCPYCEKARKYFAAKGIPYVEYDIEKNAAAHAAYREMGGQGVPLIVVGRQRMQGFSPAQFEKIHRQQQKGK